MSSISKHIENIGKKIVALHHKRLPVLEEKIDLLIASQTDDCHQIESTLDTLLDASAWGIGDHLFIRLLEYYKTIHPEGAATYWGYYEEMDGEVG